MEPLKTPVDTAVDGHWSTYCALYLFNIFAVFAVLTRLMARRDRGVGFGWDDISLVFALLLTHVMFLIGGELISLNFGVSADTPGLTIDFEKVNVFGRVFRLLFLASIFMIKLSAMLFYMRAFCGRPLNRDFAAFPFLTNTIRTRGCNILAALMPSALMATLRKTWDAVRRRPSRRLTYIYCILGLSLWTIANVVQEFLICGPHRPMCERQRYADLAVCAFNAFCDIVILCLPIWPIWQLQINRRTKIQLSIIFLVGVVATAIAFVRFDAIFKTAYGGDYNGTALASLFYANVEPNLVIICLCFPPVRGLGRAVTARGEGEPDSPADRRENSIHIGMTAVTVDRRV